MYFCVDKNISAMKDLQILTSKKGTKVVTATNLHLALQLPNQHYAANIKKWLTDVYEFKDGIRRPVRMQDYARRPVKDNPIVEDYYLSVELAKLITLNSKSKVKQKYAKWLFSLEDKVENAELLTKDQVIAVLEIAKAMGLLSCQEACEKRHLHVYEERNGGQANDWWKHRAQILGYNSQQLKEKLRRNGQKPNGKSQKQMLIQVDKYEMVRTGVIDLFMAMGKSERYARNLGDLAKILAKEIQVDIYDDRDSELDFGPKVNTKLVEEVKKFELGGVLSHWQRAS